MASSDLLVRLSLFRTAGSRLQLILVYSDGKIEGLKADMQTDLNQPHDHV